MKPINVELTMGHDIGVSASYYKPTEREVLEDYRLAIPLLTISSSSDIIKAKLQDRDNAMQKMKEKHDADIALLKQKMSLMEQIIENTMRH